MRSRLLIAALAGFTLLGGGPALAGGAREELLAGTEAFSAGTLEALALGADGVLRPGMAFEATALGVPTAWAALRHGDSLWIGTGNEGQLLRRGPKAEIERIALPATLMVTALAPLPQGAVAAAVFPGGRILRVGADAKVTALATLPSEHIWALVSDARGGLTAACGVPGALYSVDPLGAVSLLAEVGDDHARCLTRLGDEWCVGTAPKGLVVAIGTKGRRVLRDLETQEVVGLVAIKDGNLLVAANADEAGGNAQQLAGLLRQIDSPQETKAGAKPAEREALQDGSVSLLEPSGVLTTLWEMKKVAALSLVAYPGGGAVGTHPGGRIYSVAADGQSALVADLPESEASVLLPQLQGVITSNPAVLHEAKAASSGTFTSAPLDSEAPSTWGRMVAQGRGLKGAEARTGESAEPDDGWGAWRALNDFDGQGGNVHLTGRFLQIRVTLEGADAELRSLALMRRTPNRAPRLPEFQAKREGDGKPGELPTAGSKITLTWKVEDDDGDEVRATLSVRREDSQIWRDLLTDKELDKPTHEWETSGWPDGRYQVRLVVSDGASNSEDRARSAQALLPHVTVDNTPPTVAARARREANGKVHVQGEVIDAAPGRIVRIRASLNGKDWIVLPSSDGLLDSAHEAFSSLLSAAGDGAVDVVVQAMDAHGNVASASATTAK